MSTLGRTRIRIAGDAACFDAPLDALRRATPQFWRGNDVQFEIAAFFNGVLLEVSNLASLTLEIRPLGPGGMAPDPAFAPLMGATVTDFDNTTTLDNWNAGTKQHAVATFTAAQSNIVAGSAWLSVFVVTTDSPGRVITLCAGPVRVLEDGSGLASTPTPAGDTFYTAVQSDARFAAIGEGGEGAPASDSNPLMNGTAAPGTATAYARTDHVHPSDTSRAPAASPTLTGTPTAPTVSTATDSSTKIATTAFVQAAISAAGGGGGGGGTWGSITGTLSSQTDLASALSAKAPLASPTFTGSPVAPTPGGSDDSTKIATTAWVRGYTAPIDNDGDGHYVFGGGDPADLATGATAILTVNGGFSANSTDGCHLLTNSGETFDDVLHIMRTTTNSGYFNASSAIDFRPNPNLADDTNAQIGGVFIGGQICGAVGCTNVKDRSYAGLHSGAVYISGSCPFNPEDIETPSSGVGEVAVVQEGIYPSNGYRSRSVIHGRDDWAIIFQSPLGNVMGSFLPPTNSGAVEFNISGVAPYTGGSAGSGSAAQFSARSSDDTYGVLASYNSAYSYHAYPANGAAVFATGSGGLMVGATNGSGFIKFLAGGDQSSNEALRIESTKRLVFSNAVTSAPSGTLANGQYEVAVYDDGSAPVLRVRYKNSGGTVKTGDVALS